MQIISHLKSTPYLSMTVISTEKTIRMENIYPIIIEFKNLHPVEFWTVVVLVLLILISAIALVVKWKKHGKQQIEQKGPLIVPQPPPTSTGPTKYNPNEKQKIVPPIVQEPPEIYRPEPPVDNDNVSKPDVTKEYLPYPDLPTIEEPPPPALTHRVNYESSKPEQIDFYPIFRCPKKDTVVRSYRDGNTKRRGFKETAFQKAIEHSFSDNFIVAGDIRINTGTNTRPFEPDIALIDKENNSLRIDIEIDEPYAGITRQPTHCKGEDTLRDIYFVDRGWIVLRFSEFQVHTAEKNCLRFIAEIIRVVNPSFQIPGGLADCKIIENEKLWDIVQAQKWEKEKYRENYLNHKFEEIPEEPETRERSLNKQEIKEEGEVKPTSIGDVDKKSTEGFNSKNAHGRDKRIEFYPEPHIYTIDKIPAPSASTVISKFFPEFDSAYWSERNAFKHGVTPEELAEKWKKDAMEAAQKGTYLHEQIEKYYLNQKHDRTEEFHLFEKFASDHPEINPYRSEWRIFDEKYHIAGTIDLISKNGNGYEIYDWKRSKKVIDGAGNPICDNCWQCGVGQLSDIDDTSYNHYCLQQSLYRYILENNYRLRISRMYLIVLHPNYNKYYKVETPYWREQVEFILKTL